MQPSSATDGVRSPLSADDPATGARFAQALARKDFHAITRLLDATIDFRAMTPRRVWEATSPQAAVDEVFSQWFEESDTIDDVLSIETDSVSDRQRVAYRFRGHNPDGPFVVEQQAYYTESDGRINWMRVLCSGFRPG